MSRLWDLVSNRQRIEPAELQEAIAEQLKTGDLDYRTRLLIHESAQLLRDKFSVEFEPPGLPPIQSKPGFPSLGWKVGPVTKPDTIKKFLRELGRGLSGPTEIVIGGSSSLILQGLLIRNTEDVDVVDEVPPALRNLRSVQSDLHIAHFQSHFLPDGWELRQISLGDFGHLRVYLVDGLDIYLGKIFSAREKDQADLTYLQPRFEKERVLRHLQQCGKRLAGDPKLRQAADDNWYIQYGDKLPI